MSYVTPIGSSEAQIHYRLGGAHGCATQIDPATGAGLSVHTDPDSPLLWIGEGLHEVGIEPGTVLYPEFFWQAISLLNGIDPSLAGDGERLVRHKLAVPPDAKVAASPLVRAVYRQALARDVSVEVLLGSGRLVSIFRRAERVLASRGESAALRADHAGQVADRAGVTVADLWGEDRYREAVANLTESYPVVLPDGSLGVRRVKRRVTVGNLGYDITLTVPKSDSLINELLPGEEAKTAAGILDMRYEAVTTVFGWLERTCGYGLRGHHGDGKQASRVDGTGMLGWTLTHRAARPVPGRAVGDPHWHVHGTIANLVRGEDGQWSTIGAGGRDLMRHLPAAEKILHALIRHTMHTEHGVHYARHPRTGVWEIVGIPEQLRYLFSKRSTNVEEVLADLGFDPDKAPPAALELAKAHGRGAKPGDIPASALREVWRQEAHDAGFDLDAILREVLSGRHGPAKPAPTAEQIAAVLADPNYGLTSHRRRFSRADALAAVADQLPAGAADIVSIEHLTDRVLTDSRFVRLGEAADLAGSAGERPERGAPHMSNAALYTTGDIVVAESLITIRAAGSRATPLPAAMTTAQAQMTISAVDAAAAFPMSGEQRAAVIRMLTGTRPVEAVNGAPGSGKTTMMRAARVGWESAGMTVRGTSTQAMAAQNLQAESGIESLSIEQWMWRIDQGDGLEDVDVLVVDEAAMTDDRHRARLYQEAERTRTKIVEVGDVRQLRGVGCGSMFGAVHDAVDGLSLTENRRQSDEDERAAIAAWRDDRYVSALSIWASKGRLVATETSHEATTAMTATWMRLRAGCPDPHTELRGIVMLAATNEQVDRLNAAAQAVRASLRQTGPTRDYHLPGGRLLRLAVGDYVMLRFNSRGQWLHRGDDVFNGYRGVIDHIAADGSLTVSWRKDGPNQVEESATLDPRYVASGGVDLGYALTIHKAQGLTIAGQWRRPDGSLNGGAVLVYGPGADNNGLHVATSRNVGEMWLFGSREELETPQDDILYGVPSTQTERDDRLVAALAERAKATEVNANDRSALEDLARLDQDETQTPLTIAERVAANLADDGVPRRRPRGGKRSRDATTPTGPRQQPTRP